MLAREEEVNANGITRTGQEVKAAAAAGIAAASRQLDSLGLVPLLLDMLRALGPPPKTKQEQQRQQEQPSQPPQTPQHQQPYAGYRSDVLAVLSNMCFQQRPVQDAVLAGGGIELLLSNCTLDDSSPLAREWALWAIRNMCEGNAQVQAYVSQFRAVDAVQTPELDRMGMQVELDNLTHKLKLVKKPGQEPQLVPQPEEEDGTA